MAWLLGIVNGTGLIEREVGIGRRRIDVLVRWPFIDPRGGPPPSPRETSRDRPHWLCLRPRRLHQYLDPRLERGDVGASLPEEGAQRRERRVPKDGGEVGHGEALLPGSRLGGPQPR
jgi:hypothetical protein